MKRSLAALTALGLLVAAAPAFADDSASMETKEKVQVGDKKAKHTKETKVKSSPDGAGSTTDTAKTETSAKMDDDGSMTKTKMKKKKHDAPGMKDDSKSEMKTTTKTDAAGNVTEQKTETK